MLINEKSQYMSSGEILKREKGNSSEIKMRLNPDIYHDLAWEFMVSKDDILEILSKFMFSGNESLSTVRNFARKMDCLEISDASEDDQCDPFYSLRLIWDDGAKIYTTLSNQYTKHFVHWGLSSVKRVKIYIESPLPKYITDLLLENKNFKELKLIDCDLLSAKRLVESRRFDYIKIGWDMANTWGHISISAEELKFTAWLSLALILNADFINTTSLKIGYSDENFDDSFLTMDINSKYGSLKNLELGTMYMDVSNNTHKILKFLDLITSNLPNLNSLTFNFEQDTPDLNYNSRTESFNLFPSFINDFVNYENDLAAYNEKVQVKINHDIRLRISSSSKKAIENYMKRLKEELRSFQYLSKINNSWRCHYFKKSSKIGEKISLKISVQLI
ncbi:hypothetical protein FO519_009121 [Halicephalobus sp. NKZ332]|nr:hypothetical protein FO519_009121 [Halicephalobus sp. NKZ332]